MPWGNGQGWRPLGDPSDWRIDGGNPLGRPATPRGDFPRKLRDLANGGDVGAILMGTPVIGMAVNGNTLVPGQHGVTTNTATASTGGDGAGLHYRRLRRSGGGVKERWFDDWGPVPFHHIVDPTQGQAACSIILSDLIVPTFDSGHAWVFFGLGGLNTATDETSWTGVVWKTNYSDLYWTSGLYTGTGTPSTTTHETTHSGLSFNATGVTQAHRLSIELAADTKTINWYANGVLVDSYTPAAALGQFTNCPHMLYYGITNASADCSIYCMGGGNPRALTLVPID